MAQAAAKMTAKPVVDEAQYLSRVDGLIFGDSPSEGIVQGSRFVHPELRLELRFPDGWEIVNTKTQVLSKAPDREHYLLLQVAGPAQRSVEEVARSAAS